jgi:ubiquinone biosynthesis UbiH/UbiF/VisC/COQ6 family hydroxylase
MMFDVTIVGGGLVGAALARALQGSGLKCALIDAARPPGETDAWDSRIYTFSPATQSFLHDIGIWAELDPARIAPVRLMRVFGDTAGSRLEFSAYECGVERLASIVESGRLHHALWRALEQQADLSLYCPDRPASLRYDGDAVEIGLESGTLVRSRLVVGADGMHSWVRTASGVACRFKPLGQSAVVANFACAVGHRDTAYQWFRNDGVLAWLPLPGDRMSMVWSTSEAHAHELVGMPGSTLCERVAEAGAYTLGSLELVTAAASFPLARLSVPSRVRPRLALIGDAAHAIHPLAGQGVNLGFGDAQGLARLLRQARRHEPESDPGDWLVLRRFERSRAEHILAMSLATGGLQRLFQAQWPGVAQLRNLGLNLTDRVPVIKTMLARRAMGYSPGTDRAI